MAEKDKKYYWLKLKRDFFKRHDIQIIEDMPNGKDYILFYLKLLCESVDHDGNLRFNEEIPYNEEMLSTITRTNIDTIRSAIKVFKQLKMLEILDDGTIYMREVHKMLGCETYWAEQKRIQRQSRTLIGHCPTSPSKSIDIEIDKDIEIEKEIINKKETSHPISVDVDAESIFNEMMKELAKVVTPISYETFFSKQLKHRGIKGTWLVLEALPFIRTAIENNYSDRVVEAIKTASNGRLTGYFWED